MSTTKNQTRETAQYKIVAQCRNSYINAKNILTDSYFVMPAYRIAADQSLLDRFSSEDACIIGFIANESNHIFEL